MKRFGLLLLIIFFIAKISAHEKDFLDFFTIETSKDDTSLTPPPAFAVNALSTFMPQLPKVNVITGEYCEEECDLIVAGIEPLTYRRFYEHQGHKDQIYGHWRINPESFLLFNFYSFQIEDHKHPIFTGVGEENGALLLYEKNHGNQCTLDTSKVKNLTNASFLSGQQHPLNTCISFEKKKKNKEISSYQGVIKNGDGRRRTFFTEEEKYPGDGSGRYHLEYLPPFQAKIKEERKPNGNIVEYFYMKFNENAQKRPYYILKALTAYNSDKTIVLGTLNIHYERSPDNPLHVEKIRVSGSDHRMSVLHHHIREVQRKKKMRQWLTTYKRPAIKDIVLDHVEPIGKPTQNYNYHWDKAKYYFVHPYMFHAGQADGRALETIYDFGKKKVTAQKASIGPNGEMLPIARYEYYDGFTVVYDGENNKTIFRYNGDKRITTIEKYERDQLLCVERSEWDSSTGNLLSKKIEDTAGHSFQTKEFAYDKNHNVIEEKTESDTIVRTYSDDGFNLKLSESDRPGKCIRFTYLPDTNLLTSEVTYLQDQIVKRTFHFYDKEISSILVKTILDDGHSLNPYDLTGVTYRKIIEIQPKRDLPCLGLPAEVKEKTIDTSGNEILLSKVSYSYHRSGKILREDHYDATDSHRFAIINEYDDQERLISTTDALGHVTTFAYDENFNLISQDGPRNDVHKEWSYDKVNRPIQEREWQTDGAILITEKKYNKCSKLVATTDSCGFETRYDYNAQGGVIAIYHPDGAIEKKEYDILGNVTKEIDANGYSTRKEYNFRNQPTAIYHPDGRKEYFTYNANGGTLASHMDPSGTKKVYTYDLLDNPIKIDTYSVDGVVTKTATYSPFCKLSETDGEGVTTHYAYDYAGRMIAKQMGTQVTSYAYDALGRLYRTQEGNNVSIELFNEKDLLIEKRIEDADGNLYFKETYTYDELGNPISRATCAGTTYTEYNSRGAPIQKTDPLGNRTHIAYSYDNCLTQTTTDPKGISKVEIHDSRGRLIDQYVKNPAQDIIQRSEKKYDPAGNQTHSIEYVYEGRHLRETVLHQWVYGPCGRIDKIIEAGEKITQHFYDQAGRIIKVIKPDGTELHSSYDGLGRLLRYYGPGIDYSYTYDFNDRLTQVFDNHQNAPTLRSYDLYGNLIEEKLASGVKIRSDYDPFCKRMALYLPDGSTVQYTYQGPYLHSVSRKGLTHTYSERNLAGMPTQTHLPNHSGALSITWDPLLRCTHVASSHYHAEYSYDALGNLTQCAYEDPLGSNSDTYQYDDLNQLISENAHHYHYDSLYNRTAKDDSLYVLNPLSQVMHDGQKAYIYDKNGNLISDGTSSYEYDVLDRLIAVTKGQTKTTYTYDPFNRRIAKNKDLYIWDGKKEIGMIRDEKVRELRILGEGLGAEIGSAVIFEIDGSTYIPIHDIQGSLVTMIDRKGKPHGVSRYTAFGEQKTKEIDSPWGFAGKRYDDETGFIYFGRRYYAPHLGRWVTADPLGFDDGPNLYAYVHNSPFTSLDMHGLFSWGNTLTGAQKVGTGFGKQMRDGIEGNWYAAGKAGEWFVADSFYEAGDPSYFHSKSRSSVEGWKELGRAAYNHPLTFVGEALFPGVMAAIRSPRDPEAWGRAAFDIGLIGASLFKIGQVSRLANAGRVGRVGQETAFAAKIASTSTTCIESSSNAFRLKNRLISQEISGGHAFEKHILNQGEFSGWIRTRNQFAQHIENVLNNPTSMKELRNGRVAFWHQETGTVVIRNPSALDGGTAFQPLEGINYFETRLR